MRQLLLVTLVILIFLGCKKEESNDCAGIYPLKTGNSWVYKTTYYSPSGTVDSTKNSTTLLRNTITIAGNSYYSIDSFYYPLRNKDCNTLALYDANSSKEFQIITTAGQNDTLAYYLPNQQGTQNCRGIKVFLNKDRLVVNGMNCYKVEFQFISCVGAYYRKRFYWVNESVGMVRSEGYDVNETGAVLTDVEEVQTYKLQ